MKQNTDAKRAIEALTRKLLVIIYKMLNIDYLYKEKMLERKQSSEQRRLNRMIHELSRLGNAAYL